MTLYSRNDCIYIFIHGVRRHNVSDACRPTANSTRARLCVSWMLLAAAAQRSNILCRASTACCLSLYGAAGVAVCSVVVVVVVVV